MKNMCALWNKHKQHDDSDVELACQHIVSRLSVRYGGAGWHEGRREYMFSRGSNNMRIDHLVINVDKKYQADASIVSTIQDCGFPYEPKWSKGTSGFKASNIWIGNEYFEMIRLLNKSGGGWREEWVKRYDLIRAVG